MANSLTVSQLEQAHSLIVSGHVSAFYDYMAHQGYSYAALAKGLVDESSISGRAALAYMQQNATEQGLTLTDAQIVQIETRMANSWLDALETVAQGHRFAQYRPWPAGAITWAFLSFEE